MSKAKVFLIGVLFGCFLLSGVAFAVDQIQLTVQVPKVSFSLNGSPITQAEAKPDAASELPPALEYEGVLYAQLPLLSDALGMRWHWDEETAEVKLETPSPIEFNTIAYEDAPEPIMRWVKQSLNERKSQARYTDGSTYILISRGVKNTGGYDVRVHHIEELNGILKIYVELINPVKGELVTQAVTYPYTLVKVNGEYREVKFTTLESTP